MRADTAYRRGEWSEVIVISDGSLSPSGSCVTENITTEDPISSVPNSTVVISLVPNSTGGITTEDSTSLVPVMIAAGALVAIIVLVTLTVGIVACTKLRRRKIRLQHYLKRQVIICM